MSEKRRKLSGAAYRKRKLEKEEKIKKGSASITHFFQSVPSSSNTTPTETEDLSSNYAYKEYENEIDVNEGGGSSLSAASMEMEQISLPSEVEVPSQINTTEDKEPESTSITNESKDVSSTNIAQLDLNDPGLWPKIITDEIRMLLIEIGPKQVKNFNFPINNKRSFAETYYIKTLSNGEKVNRDWLVYSTSKNSVYCFYCKIFANNDNAFNNENGYCDWKHLSRTIERHEKSKAHLNSFKSVIDLNKLTHKNKTVDALNEKVITLEKKRWRLVIERIIHGVQYLAGQNLAFRGTNNKLFNTHNGNFLKLVETFAQFDGVMAEHLNRVQSNENKMPHYLGEKIQNELIFLIGGKIKAEIITSLKLCKYYAIILDCTPDISHQEQISIIVRFVHLNNINKKIEIREHFLGFCPILDSTGEGLIRFIIDFLNQENISIYDMRGQGYDNGANMRGKHNGLQKKILDVNPRAFYVPCASHSLNLVINDAAKASLEITNFFTLIQEIYVFFSSSTRRWQILMNECPSLTVKPVSETRWESRIDAVKVLRYNLESIYDALYVLFNDSTRDTNTRNIAKSLIKKIKSYKFICSIVIWYNILSKVNVVSKFLQKCDLVIPTAIEMLKDLNNYLQEYRSDEFFKNMLNEAQKIAQEIDCETEFPAVDIVRPRRKKRMFMYENMDESPESPLENYKVNFYFTILDTAISKIEERFELMTVHNETFQFLNNIYSLLELSRETKIKYCMDLQIKLSDIERNESDINALDLCDEIEILLTYIKPGMNALAVLDYIFSNDLTPMFPNITIALRIFLTIPVTVASGERSFSKLKLIKNYLRSTMSQERLTNLSLISIENKIAADLDTSDLINEFALKKARKINF